MNRIDTLRKLSPQDRLKNMERLQEKNRQFFSDKNPKLAKMIANGSFAPFHLSIDDKFLSIVNKETGELCHPEIGLDVFAEHLGDWTHQAWIDMIEGKPHGHPDYGKYSQYPQNFQGAVLNRFPGLYQRMQKREINLPTLKNGKRFSNSVVFAGIFHGLHIDYYLSRTQVNSIALIEPDPARFVLSSCFLDYEALHKRFDGVLLHVGEEFPERHVDRFFRRAQVTGPVWVRILPGYASENVEPMLRQLRLKWRQMYDVWMAPETQLEGMSNAMENVRAGKKIFTRTVELSKGSRIAVVGSGPSLDNDLAWLKQHQDDLIIFSAYSTVSALQRNGINPDFQFSIETRPWEDELFERLNLDPQIPVVCPYNDDPDKFKDFKDVYMVARTFDSHPVSVRTTINNIDLTTGNMCIAFACACQPDEIYLFGMDLGFRKAEATHVSDSSFYEDEGSHEMSLGSRNLSVAANFSDGAPVYTQSYFNSARQAAERVIRGAGSQVFNSSDGARIDGASPCRSYDIPFRLYYSKENDIDAIKASFSPLVEGEDWTLFAVAGRDLLNGYKKTVLKELKMSKYNWRKFSAIADDFPAIVMKGLPKKLFRDSHVSRMRVEPYMKVVMELLVAWYRMLCFANNESEWQQVYEYGYEKFAELVEDMSWDLEG